MSTLFDKQETDNAIDAGYHYANMDWKVLTLEKIHDICLSQENFTADDVRGILKDEDAKTHDRRAMGGIMRKAKMNGWCEATGIHVASKFTHGHLHQVWKSLIFKKQ